MQVCRTCFFSRPVALILGETRRDETRRDETKHNKTRQCLFVQFVCSSFEKPNKNNKKQQNNKRMHNIKETQNETKQRQQQHHNRTQHKTKTTTTTTTHKIKQTSKNQQPHSSRVLPCLVVSCLVFPHSSQVCRTCWCSLSLSLFASL